MRDRRHSAAVVGGVVVFVAVAGVAFGLARGGDGGADLPAAAQAGLRRELRLSDVAPMGCPRTKGGRPNPAIAIALGPGPVYPVMGMEAPPPSPRGVVDLREEELRGDRYWRKTLWAVAPTYSGPVLIRGGGIDPDSEVHFAYDDNVLTELTMRQESGKKWRYGPSLTVLPGPGCYAFQVDGTSFSIVIVFEAVL